MKASCASRGAARTAPIMASWSADTVAKGRAAKACSAIVTMAVPELEDAIRFARRTVDSFGWPPAAAATTNQDSSLMLPASSDVVVVGAGNAAFCAALAAAEQRSEEHTSEL